MSQSAFYDLAVIDNVPFGLTAELQPVTAYLLNEFSTVRNLCG